MTYSEDDLIPISALQHHIFCPRQCALIHVEQLWIENVLTSEGKVLHERAHEGGTESRVDVRTVRGLKLRSLRWGLIGQADVVEFVRPEAGRDSIALPGLTGLWRPVVVEYKRGKPKIDRCDEVQVCAQGLCLEEMLGIELKEALIFYGEPRRRHNVLLDIALRNETIEAIHGVRRLFVSGITPPAKYEKKCRNCSLMQLCLPRTAAVGRSVKQYIVKFLSESLT